jgi:hypothetical protein
MWLTVIFVKMYRVKIPTYTELNLAFKVQFFFIEYRNFKLDLLERHRNGSSWDRQCLHSELRL